MLNRQISQAVILIGAYLALGVTAIFLSAPERFRPWMAWAFAAGDIALYGWGLAFSVANTGVSGGFAFAMPTVMLAPVILAYGALRFRPELQIGIAIGILSVLIAVMLTAGGWGERPEPPESASIGFLFEAPPVIMRFLMLALSGAVLAIGVYRGKTLLVRAIDETRKRVNLTRFLPAEVASTLSDSDLDSLRRGRETHAVILFVDIRGFTAWSRRHSSADISTMLSQYRALVGRVASEHGGFVDKFVGDGALLVFGTLDDEGGDEERRALSAAIGVYREIGRLTDSSGDQPLHIGIGLERGTVFVGAVGDTDRLEFTVLGDAVNIASRLEAMTKEVGHGLVATTEFAAACSPIEPPGGWIRLGSNRLRGHDTETDLVGAYPYPEREDRTIEGAAAQTQL